MFGQLNPPIQKTAFLGSPQTVKLIISASLTAQNDYVVRQMAEAICRDLRSKDYLSEMLAILHYISANTRYMRDPATIELVKAPELVIKEILSNQRPQLDCDDLTALLAALLLAVGNRIRVVTVAFRHVFYKNERQYSHVFVQALEPRSGVWVTLDPVAGERVKNMHQRAVAVKIYNVT